jgi:hypothetical protein
MGQPETSLTGTVYDPAGKLPLYNVYVYIPNSTPLPITAGSPQCSQCQAAATGNPIIGGQTDANGHFSIQWQSGEPWGVPAGANIPLVIQVGKWRRQLTIPHVTACATNDLDTVFNMATGKGRQLRLPGTAPKVTCRSWPLRAGAIRPNASCGTWASTTANSRHERRANTHFYTGWGGSSVTGGNTYTDTYQWWSSSANLLKYDLIFNACECTPNFRGPTAYLAMQDYIDRGGRLFATYYYYNWFTDGTGGANEYENAVGWSVFAPGGGGNYYIDTTFPKGQAYGEWLLANHIATGSLSSAVQTAITDVRNDVGAAGLPNYPDSIRWIYSASKPGTNGGPPPQYATS